MPAPALYRNPDLEVTLHTDAIPAFRGKFRGIDDAPALQMSGSRPMATFATNARVREDGHSVAVVAALDWRPHAADVAMQAARVHRKIERDFAVILVSGGHIPGAPS